MRFSLRRKVEALTLDEIDEEIEEHQHKAEELVAELEVVLAEQNQLWRQLREERGDEGADGPHRTDR